MSDRARERATIYMDSIGCAFDMRVKGQRNPENKFMSGASVDNYVMGKLRDAKSKSPGLSINTMAICDIVFSEKATAIKPNPGADAEDGPPAAAPALRPAAGRGAGRGGRRRAPAGGFAVPAAALPTAASAQEALPDVDEFADLGLLDDAVEEDMQSPELR
eukprot:6204667-Pleurochrysis_carterae.AAC.1